MNPTRTTTTAARNGHTAATSSDRVLLGQVTAADSEKGVTVHLRRGQSVEQLRQGQFVVIEGQFVRFFGTISGFRLAATDPAVAQDPPDTASRLVHETLGQSTTYAECTVRPSLELTHTGSLEPAVGDTGPSDGLSPSRTIPGHFSAVYKAGSKDFSRVFGEEEDGKKFNIGTPRDMDTPVPIDLERLVERSNGIFGRSGTGKSILARLLFCGLFKSQACVNLIFDMHSEYAYARRMEDGTSAKGLRELFGGSRVLVYSLDDADSTRPGRQVDRLIRIPLDSITLEDLESLKDELDLSDAMLGAAGQLDRRLGKGWMSRLFDMPADEQKELVKEIGGHEGSVDALKRRIGRVERLSFVKQGTTLQQSGITDLISALESGRNLILQFGRNSSLLAYMLVATLITRRIHERWVKLTEDAEQDGSGKVKPLMITIEEAHKFLSQGQSIFSTIARELRKYSVTLLIVDQRPSSIDPDVMSQLGTRITALLSDERDIDAVFTGTRGGHFKNILATLDTRQEVLVFGHAVPMEVVLRTRTFDEALYRAIAPKSLLSKQERAQSDHDDLF
ncbi:MAG: ATP-binding protein [Chloroflexia bacterium]